MQQFKVLLDNLCFGEGPRWHEGRLWFSDFFVKSVKSVSLAGDVRVEFEIDDRPSGLGWMPHLGLRGREDQGLDHDWNGARRGYQAADVDEVELAQVDAVDGDDRNGEVQFLADVDPQQTADVAIADEDERVPGAE